MNFTAVSKAHSSMFCVGSTGIPSIKLKEQLVNAFSHMTRAVSKERAWSNDLC